jgi:hypothetical protein
LNLYTIIPKSLTQTLSLQCSLKNKGMVRIKNFGKILLFVFCISFLASSCAANCKAGGWYAKDRNLSSNKRGR